MQGDQTEIQAAGERLLKMVRDLPNQFKEGLRLGKEAAQANGELAAAPQIILAGMGGSGIAADLFRDVVQDKLPITIVKDYRLPANATTQTLVIGISYSGNTEEVVALFKEAQRKACKTMAITSNGALGELAGKKAIRIPFGLAPRAAVGYMLGALIGFFHYAQRLRIKPEEVQETLGAISRPGLEQKGRDLAQLIGDAIPLIYTGQELAGAGLRWKQGFNENAKRLAFSNTIPELNHNEMLALTQGPKGFFALLLRDAQDHERVRRRFDLTKDLLKQADVPAVELSLKGTSKLARLLSVVILGDFVSVHAGLIAGVDPLEVKAIEQFKLSLKEQRPLAKFK